MNNPTNPDNNVNDRITPDLPALPVHTAVAVVRLLAPLCTAVERRDRDAFLRLFQALELVAGPAWTDAAVDYLLTCALRRLASGGVR